MSQILTPAWSTRMSTVCLWSFCCVDLPQYWVHYSYDVVCAGCLFNRMCVRGDEEEAEVGLPLSFVGARQHPWYSSTHCPLKKWLLSLGDTGLGPSVKAFSHLINFNASIKRPRGGGLPVIFCSFNDTLTSQAHPPQPVLSCVLVSYGEAEW